MRPIISSGGPSWAVLLVRPDVEVGAVAGDAEHRVGDRVEQGAVPLLDELRGLERALVGEREAGGGADGVEQLRAQPQRAVVDEHPDRLALVEDRRRDLHVAGARKARAARRSRRRSAVLGAAAGRARATGRRALAAARPRGRRPLPGSRSSRSSSPTAARESRPCTSVPRKATGSASAASRPSPKPSQPGARRERGEHEPEREEQQSDLAADEHRRQLPPRRGRRGACAAGQHDDDRERDRDGDRRLELLEPGRERRRASRRARGSADGRCGSG